MFKVILFYKYTPIENPEALKKEQLLICEKLSLTGRGIVAPEGINFTLEGETNKIEKYIKLMKADKRFKDIHFKISEGTGQSFPKLSIKVRPEIVAGELGEDDVKPWITTGKYLTVEQLHEWLHSDREFFIVDMRNDIEQQVGHFESSILSGMEYFKDLPKILPRLKSLKNKTIVTVCTGGVRCEKASGFLIKHGFKDVYQLYGGIVTYMEKYPGENFKGSLYVFDQRLVMGFNMDDPQREVVGKCAKCQIPSENLINCLDGFCNRHFIVCQECLGDRDIITFPMGCWDYSRVHPDAVNSV